MEKSAQQQALDFINYTGDHLFLTGKAGTGKTTFLKTLKEKTHKSFIVLAPTGVAALNAGGVTIHSQFLFPFGSYIPDTNYQGPPGYRYFNKPLLAKKHPLNKVRKQVLKHIDLLVIDEVSMLRADLLDAIDYRMQRVKGNTLPFGGLQLLLIGDLFQLSPVVRQDEWNILQNYYQGPQFFNSLALQRSQFHTIELTKVFRQEDQHFVQFLNKLRLKELKQEDLNFINHFEREASDKEVIKLVTHRQQAQVINENQLDNLDSKRFTYRASIQDDFPESMYPVEDEIHLKEGAQVMFIKNDWDGDRFYNGKLAEVLRLKTDTIWLRMEDGEELELPQNTWENTRYSIDSESQEMKEELLGSFSQYPIRLAWAITIHKSQGLTFEKAEIDLGRVFAPGQAYVALSRLRSLNGLYLKQPLNFSSMQVDGAALAFYERGRNKDLNASYEKGRRLYLWQYLLQVFDWSAWFNDFNSEYQKRYEKLKLEEELFKNHFTALKVSWEVELGHSRKFQAQIARLIEQGDYQALEQRLGQARDYFLPKLKAILQIMAQLGAEYSELSRTKSIVDWLELLLSQGMDQYLALKSLEDYWRYFRGLDSKLKFNWENGRQNLMDDLRQKLDEVKKRPKKLKKGETYTRTFGMIKEGLRPAQIAKERGLSLGTIIKHCIRGLEEGELSAEQVMEESLRSKMLKIFKEKDSGLSLKELWQAYPDYTYDEWRLFLATQKSNS